jgi:hypothetical protein
MQAESLPRLQSDDDVWEVWKLRLQYPAACVDNAGHSQQQPTLFLHTKLCVAHEVQTCVGRLPWVYRLILLLVSKKQPDQYDQRK